MSKPTETEEDQFDWVQFKKDFAVSHEESKKEKLFRKIAANPLVPIGMEIHTFFSNNNILFHNATIMLVRCFRLCSDYTCSRIWFMEFPKG